MSQGKMEARYVLTCALCSNAAEFQLSEDEAKEQAAKEGWALTKELGWVCRRCQTNSEPLRGLLPEVIVKDRSITE